MISESNLFKDDAAILQVVTKMLRQDTFLLTLAINPILEAAQFQSYENGSSQDYFNRLLFHAHNNCFQSNQLEVD